MQLNFSINLLGRSNYSILKNSKSELETYTFLLNGLNCRENENHCPFNPNIRLSSREIIYNAQRYFKQKATNGEPLNIEDNLNAHYIKVNAQIRVGLIKFAMKTNMRNK